jgi:hypothetical protein
MASLLMPQPQLHRKGEEREKGSEMNKMHLSIGIKSRLSRDDFFYDF